MGQGGADDAMGKLVLGPSRQARSDQQSTSHPVGFAPQPPGDGGLAQTLLAGEGTDNPRLIQRGEGARGRVGEQQQAFVLHRVAGRLQDDRDMLPSLLSPTRKALEAVDDLIGVVFGGHHADG